jgi:uncharacterized protein YyaL (SSP411 family)
MEEPVRWEPWGEAAFARARSEGKRVLLSISASWCHWCHVMDEESFTHPEVIRQLNERFVPVRVDSDQRPDINSRYNMGGWPTVAVLDLDGQVVAGETYLPLGPFLSWLTSTGRLESSRQREPGPPPVKTIAAPSPAPPALNHALVATVSDWLDRTHDRTFGGFGAVPKFPQPWAIELLLLLHARTGDAARLSMATRTLDAMREGELCDPAEGGFFRYATSDDWSGPHTEKLLDVNAQLLSIYLRAYRVTGSAAYRSTAQEILNYFFSTLSVGEPSPDGAWFAGSQAADRDYYALSQEERLDVEPPPIDRTLYVDRNAMAVSALLEAGRTLEQAAARTAGLALAEFLWSRCRHADGSLGHYGGGGGGGGRGDGMRMTGGFLADQAWMLAALLDASEAMEPSSWLERARSLASVMAARWEDKEAGGFWDLPAPPDQQGSSAQAGLLRIRLKPLVDNAVAAIALTRLGRLTGETTYRNQAERTLRALAPLLAGYKQHGAVFGVALERFLMPDGCHPLEEGAKGMGGRW